MILLQGGTLYDGSGGMPFVGDVLVDGDRIEAVGRVGEVADARPVDCTGLAVAPGFIDLHSHSDLQVLEGHRAKVAQGVTTEVVGNCGFSPYPFTGDREALRNYTNGILYGEGEWGWPGAREYLEESARRANAANVVSLVGHGSLRVGFMGERQEAPTELELNRMAGCLDEALAAGAAGFSTGLMYAPGSAAPRAELVRLLKVVAKRGKTYATHMRSYSWELVESVEEQIGLAREAGCRLQISHLQAVGRKNWHKQEAVLERLLRARDEGVDVEFDSYPYLAGSTVATQLLPQSAMDGGVAVLLDRLADPETRSRLAAATVEGLAQQWSDIFVVSVASEANQSVVGKTFAQVAEENSTSPVEALFTLLTQEGGKVNILSFNQSEENLRMLLTHPLCTVISDGFYVKGRPHPRLYGTFAELLGNVVREWNWLSLAEAIHKVTGKPAARIGLSNRGALRPGHAADITVFDPARVRSLATYEEPVSAPLGFSLVMRNGEPLQ
jgi:dihydroorotase/N-acyl-D-amino-acid deacylase